MLRRSQSIPVTLVALGSLLAFTAAAQSPPQPGPGAAPPPDTAATAPETQGNNVPVLAVSSVEVVRTAHTPTIDIVVAHGVTSTDGWTDASLVPLTHGVPSDGVLDLVLTANPPREPGSTDSPAPIHAVFPLAEGHPYKGVRVRSSTDVILLQTIPGFAELKLVPWVCGPCVGKLFVARGAPVPAGVAAGDVVHQEDLPVRSRIIRPNDGIGDVRPDPNRLTILIGEDGRIVGSAWE